jgi:hypothetical protein
MLRGSILSLLAVALAFGACDKSPTMSSSVGGASLNVTGTWSGDLPLQGMVTRMTWVLTQSGTSVVGSVVVALPAGTVVMNGTFSATLTAPPAVNYTIVVTAGGLPAQPTCTGQLTGTVTAATGPPATLTGNYTVASSTCTTPFSAGTFTLTKASS